jgi:glucose/mannose-6-phosphate isomerase
VTDGLHLPAGFGENSLVILVSYSGSTWETLDAYGTASRKGARRIVLSSGGELSKCATRDGVPLIPLPPGLPPRAAVGYIIGGLLGVCDKWFARSNEDRVRKISRRLRYRQSRWAERKGLPASLAKLVGSRLPTIYADAKIGSVARRWKTQVEENAKRLALFDVFPEVLHNAIVGWDALDASRARRHALLSIAWEGQSPRVRAGMEYLHRLVRRKGVRCALVPLDSTDLLEALLFGVSIGDHFSLFLAEAAGVNPFPYRAITRMKDALRIDPAFAP